MKNFLVNTAIVILVTGVVFGGAELLVRSLYKDETVLFPRYHTDATYGAYTIRTIRPDSVFRHTSIDGSWTFITNSKGFRNVADFDYEKPDGTIRVLCLGDSHTQGYEVSQDSTFSSVIEKYLKKKGFKAEVMNAGVSGFSTAEALIFLENEGIKYKPDVVVVGFYANDLQDNIKSGLFKLDPDGGLTAAKKRHIPGVRIQNLIYAIPGIKWLSENSYFYSLLFNATWNYFKKALKRKTQKDVLEYAVPTKNTFSDYEISLAIALLQRMYRFCAKNDIRMIIMDIPMRRDGQEIKTSFPDPLSQRIEALCDRHIPSASLLADYSGVVALHRPHGHHHISGFTHAVLGVSGAKQVIDLITVTGEPDQKQ